MRFRFTTVLVVSLSVFVCGGSFSAETELHRIFSDDSARVHDLRCDEARELRTFMEFDASDSLEEWESRATALRQRIRFILGLAPEPKRTPLNPRVSGRIERDGYSVEKVAFESWPGFLVTGNLYRPTGKHKIGGIPAIVSPHGHWAVGRMADDERGSVPGRCINFARQGYVIFSYDMVGYVDSCQLSHNYGGDLEAMWGLSLMAVQTWNSIRAIDFVQTLPEVDPQKIGVTGASGGGTQAFILYSVDERPKVAAPVNMISGHMQGGCLCENAPLLRIHANNIEIGALFAPKPFFMVSCTGDWTDETPINEYPSIHSVYQLYGHPERIGTTYVDSGHNFNQESREAVYTWFARWLKGDTTAGHVAEKPYTKEPDEALKLFLKGREGHPFPEVDDASFTKARVSEIKAQLDSMALNSLSDLSEYRRLYLPQWEEVLGAAVPERSELACRRIGRKKQADFHVGDFILGRKGEGDQVPAILLIPTTNMTNPDPSPKPATVLVHPAGKSAFFDSDSGQPRALVTELLAQGHRVLIPDTFLTGEYHPANGKTERKRYDGLYSVYNYTDTACRVQDILTCVGYLQSRVDVGRINLVGLETSGIDVALARPLAPEVAQAAVDLAGLDLQPDSVWLDSFFVPCLRRLGDIRSALILGAPGPCLVQRPASLSRERIQAAYAVADRPNNLSWSEKQLSDKEIANWLVP